MRIKIVLTDLAHFTFGLISAILGLTLEATLAFTVYEVMDTWLKWRVWGEDTSSLTEREEERMRLKRELRSDLIEFFAGVIIGRLFVTIFLSQPHW